MITALIGFTNFTTLAVGNFVATHANEAYLHAAYAGQLVSTLSLHQYFS